MQIVICDDDNAVRNMLADKIKKICPDADVFSFQSGAELLAGGKTPDILMLDIQMPGMDGMEVARIIRTQNSETIIIFVTAWKDYVFQAFDVRAFHYLVKPFDDQKLEEVLACAIEQCENRRQEKMIPSVQQKQEKYIMVKNKGMHFKIKVSGIIYAEVFNRKITIHSVDGDVEYYGRMSELEKQAGEDFFRTHRGYLVHLKYVVRYDASTIYLERGTALMSKSKFPDFVKEFLKYNKRNCPSFQACASKDNNISEDKDE